MPMLAIVGEDDVCVSLAFNLARHANQDVDIQIVKCAGGYGPFVAEVAAMNNVARSVMPVLMLADADQDTCVVRQLRGIAANIAANLSLRLAVREAEAWLLADAQGLSQFAEVSPTVIPRDPESLRDPKQELLNVVRRSKRRVLRDEMLPVKGASSPVGFGYNLHLKGFISDYWCPMRASERAPSLARALPRIQHLLRDGA